MNKQIPKKLLKSMAEFCHRHFYFLDMTVEEYEPLLEWFHSDGRLSAIYDDENNVYALGLFRFLNRVEERLDQYFHDENGDILFVDAWIDPDGVHGEEILSSVFRRKRHQIKFSYVRDGKKNSDLRTFPIEKMKRFASQETILN